MAAPSYPAPTNLSVYSSALSGRTIRLLQLEAGSREDPIQCSLTVKPLDNHTVYNALSYAWGEPNPTRTISCNKRRLDVGENLYQALLQLRQDGRTELLWVDAVCINQSDNDEKTEQVRMMRDIYEQATLVIAWLGNEEDKDEEGFSLMKQLYRDLQGASLIEIGSPDFTPLDKLRLPAMDDLKWKALCKILLRPYFFRAWIIQEILVGDHCIFQCGSHVIDRSVIFSIGAVADKFYNVKEMLWAHIPTESNVTESIFADMTMNAIRDKFSESYNNHSTESQIYSSYSVLDLWFLKLKLDAGDPLTILQLLMSSRAFNAKDPRDKIFALVGLAPNVRSDFIDYNESLANIQVKLAKICMQEQRTSLGPMLFSFIDQKHHSDVLPSWVPDWTSGGPIQNPLASSFYNARFATHQSQNWNFTSDAGSLLGNSEPLEGVVIRGKVFDKIASIVHQTPYMISTPTLRNLSVLANHCKEMDEWGDASWGLVENLTAYPTGENIYEAYWRTLIFNTENAGSEPSKELDFSYKTWASFYITLTECIEILKSKIQEATNDTNLESQSTWRRVTGLFTKLSSRWQNTITYGKLHFKGEILKKQQEAGAPFDRAFKQYSIGRKFCITANGYIGWVPFEAQTSDVVCYFKDCKLPFIIRAGEGGYRLVGDCYFHGLMYDSPPGLDMSTLETITLI